MDIKLDKDNMQVSLVDNGDLLKIEEISQEDFKEYMHELCRDDEMLKAMRLSSKLMKVKSYTFKGIT